MRTVLLLLLLLLCVQIGIAPVVQGCERISPAGTCSDGCQDDQESNAPDQCGSCACCRLNEPLTLQEISAPPSVPVVFGVVPSEGVGPSPWPADIFRPPKIA